jgi:hypothetical protein
VILFSSIGELLCEGGTGDDMLFQLAAWIGSIEDRDSKRAFEVQNNEPQRVVTSAN